MGYLNNKWLVALTKWGQLDIPKGHNSEWFLFRKVLISKGHYSEEFYPEGSLFQRFFFLSRRVIIPKIFIQKGRYPEFRNNDPPGFKSLD